MTVSDLDLDSTAQYGVIDFRLDGRKEIANHATWKMWLVNHISVAEEFRDISQSGKPGTDLPFWATANQCCLETGSHGAFSRGISEVRTSKMVFERIESPYVIKGINRRDPPLT